MAASVTITSRIYIAKGNANFFAESTVHELYLSHSQYLNPLLSPNIIS